MTPEEAADLIVQAIIEKPDRIATRLGLVAQVLHAVAPKISNIVMNTAYRMFPESAAALGRVLPRLCRAVMKATGAAHYNLLQNNGATAHQVVMHVHFNIIPRFPQAGLIQLPDLPESEDQAYDCARRLVDPERTGGRLDALYNVGPGSHGVARALRVPPGRRERAVRLLFVDREAFEELAPVPAAVVAPGRNQQPPAVFAKHPVPKSR